MFEKFRIKTGYGDVYWVFWATAILFYVGWDTVSTHYGMEVWNMAESVPFSRLLINEYGILVFGAVKLLLIAGLFIAVHAIPDSIWTLNYSIPINEEYLKDIYIPATITLLGVYATIHNFFLV